MNWLNGTLSRACRRFGPALLLTVSCSWAQVTTGSVAGQVTDQTGAVVPAVSVRLINEGTGAERTVQTDAAGNYVFALVAPGFYRLVVAAPGFKVFQLSGLEVQVAQRVTQNVQLEVGDTATTLEVVATAPVLDQRSAEIGQVISEQEITDLPLNGRNFLDLSRLVPGVSELPGFSQSTGISVNGQRANQIAFYFDGIDTRVEHSGKPAFTPSIDAIQEFKIHQNAFSAEFGRAPAAINLSLKPGTNKFHGTLFEFLRNDKLDARSFFAPTRDVLRRNQFGGVLSGPIVRQKAFFMVNYEGLRTRRSRTVFRNVPSVAQRGGDFSGGAPIFDPMTLDPQTNQRLPFPNNVIPRTRFGRIGNAALNYYPQPNLQGVKGFNFVAPASLVNDSDQFHFRADLQLSDSDLLFGRYSYATTNNDRPAGLPLTGTFIDVETHNFTLQESHTFGPAAVNEFRIAWTYYDYISSFPRADRNLAVEEFGLKNLNPPAISFGLPFLAVTGLSSMGANRFSPQGSRENIYTLADDLNLIRGKHNLKFGFEGRYYRPALLILATPNGTLDFRPQFSNQPGVPGTGNAVADLVLGFPWRGRGTQLVESNGLVSLKYFHLSGYAQDEIKLRPNLTVNIGLRYEYQTPFKERFNDVFSFDYVNGRFLEPGIDIPHLQRPDRNNFAPRVGIAYSVTPKTVIRAGGGVFYGLIRSQEFPAFHLSPPFTVDATLFSDPLVPDLPGRLFPPARVRDPETGEVLLTPDTGVFALDENFRTAYTYQWNFSVQRELAPQWLFEAAYVGNSAHKLIGRDLVNQAFLDPDPINNPTPVNSRRPIPQIGDVSMVKSLDNSNYHALNVKINKRFSDGFSLIGAYTFGKALGIGGALFGDQSRAQNARDRDAEYGPLDIYTKHRLTVGWVYELPFGEGKPLLSGATGVAGKLVSGWSFQGIYTAHSGFPIVFDLRSSVSANVGRQDMNRPDRICDGNLPKSERTLTRYFDTRCFVDHPFGRFGNSGNGVIFGPGLNNFDLTFMKNTVVAVRDTPVTLQFRAEFFNAFNHPSFGDPRARVGTPQYGVIRSTRTNGREIQLALKLIF